MTVKKTLSANCIGLCVLNASTVNCQYSQSTRAWLTPWPAVDQHLEWCLVDTRCTLNQDLIHTWSTVGWYRQPSVDQKPNGQKGCKQKFCSCKCKLFIVPLLSIWLPPDPAICPWTSYDEVWLIVARKSLVLEWNYFMWSLWGWLLIPKGLVGMIFELKK